MNIITKALIASFLVFFVLIIGGIFAHSGLIIAEAFHQIIDSVGYIFAYIVMKKPQKYNSKYTYGYHRLEVISGMTNIYLVITGALLSGYIAISNYFSNVHDFPVVVAIISAVSLIIMYQVIVSEKHDNINEKSVWVHAVADLSGFIIGAIVGVVIFFTHAFYLDPLAALIIIFISLALAFPNLKEIILVLMEASPNDTTGLEAELKKKYPNLHHLHIWLLCSHMKMATLHLTAGGKTTVMELDKEGSKIEKILKKHGINHVTVQFESAHHKLPEEMD